MSIHELQEKRTYTEEDLEMLWQRAFSFESRDKHGKEMLSTTLAGKVERGNRIYDIYVDIEDNAWYIVRIRTKTRIVSEYEAVFGHKPRRKRK